MRHLGSLLLSLLSATFIYLLAGIGMVKFTEIQTADGTDWAAAGIGFGVVIAAGLLYVVMLFMRLSPVGLVAAGLVFAAVTVWAVFWPDSFLEQMPANVASVKDAGQLAAGPLTLLLSVPLVATVFSVRRWSRYDTDHPALFDPVYPDSAVATFPKYTPPAASTVEYPVPSSAAPAYSEYTPPADPYAVYTPPSHASQSEEPTEAGPTAPNPSYPIGQLPPDPSKPY